MDRTEIALHVRFTTPSTFVMPSRTPSAPSYRAFSIGMLPSVSSYLSCIMPVNIGTPAAVHQITVNHTLCHCVSHPPSPRPPFSLSPRCAQLRNTCVTRRYRLFAQASEHERAGHWQRVGALPGPHGSGQTPATEPCPSSEEQQFLLK